jgi:hypothetical protein
MRPGDRDILVAAPDATKLSYTSSRPESAQLELGVSDTRADYDFTIGGVSAQPGAPITLRLPTEGGSLTIDNAGSAGASSMNLKMERETQRGVQVFVHDGIHLIAGDTGRLDFGHWTGGGKGIAFVTTQHGHRSTQVLTDQATG